MGARGERGLRIPEFGAQVRHREEPCSPAELFMKLHLDPEEHVHYFEPAFEFLSSVLRQSEPPELADCASEGYADQLGAWALRDLPRGQNSPLSPAAALRIAVEFAPLGLSDGAWLSGSMLANRIETEVGMRLLKQFMTRFGDPGTAESYVQRYVRLLESLGVAASSITSPRSPGSMPCADISYEHGLLGVTLGLFPSTFGAETLGYNLWMASVGPCPWLTEAAAALRAQSACLRYLDRYDGASLARWARDAVERALLESDQDPAFRARVGRGFAAAHLSYRRWYESLSELMEGAEHAPQSGRAGAGRARRGLIGEYGPPQDADSLREFAFARYGQLSTNELYYCFANSDCHPGVHLFGRAFVSQVLAKVQYAMASDSRLNSQNPPEYSERTLAELVSAQHAKNVRARKLHEQAPEPEPEDDADDPPNYIGAIFDGCWLQGFADVRRADFEEYGWLFRIYASEHGDGQLAWNHSWIYRQAFSDLGPDILLPKTDLRLYELFEVSVGSVAKMAIALNTRHFMPEILGLNLAIEASGVGGTFIENWKAAEQLGMPWKALAARLHNSIDNYADGHTKWSLAAVQSFMRRIKDGAPAEADEHWGRIWRLWRLQDILDHGTEDERRGLAEHIDVTTLSPTG